MHIRNGTLQWRRVGSQCFMYTLYEAATIYFAGNEQNWQIIMQSNCAEVEGRRHRAVRAPQKKLYCRQNNKSRNSSKNVTITADIFTSGRSFSCTNSSGELGLSGGKSTDVKILIRNEASPYGDHCSGKGP